MSRTALTALAAVLLSTGPAVAIDPHIDPSIVEIGCPACHLGHGVSRSPMLPAPQRQVCMECHESPARVGRLVAERVLAATASPQFLSQVFSEPFVHPVSEQAYSRNEPGAVTCTSCHSAHRDSRMADLGSEVATGFRKLSPRDPSRFEFELCQSCHGDAGRTTLSPTDLSRLLNPNNRSYHPVEAPSNGLSPSVIDRLRGREINCTDCHGNSNPEGPRGPHGSAVSYILRFAYTTVDGSDESERLYALCYACHDRDLVLEFPLHFDHVVTERSSCFSCHNPHGSVDNRALIRFGDNTIVGGLSPSISTGRLAFVSVGPGSGTCFLTCHGVDHGPKSYGPGSEFESVMSLSVPGGLEGELFEPLSLPTDIRQSPRPAPPTKAPPPN